jgi:hypothetical protein
MKLAFELEVKAAYEHWIGFPDWNASMSTFLIFLAWQQKENWQQRFFWRQILYTRLQDIRVKKTQYALLANLQAWL